MNSFFRRFFSTTPASLSATMDSAQKKAQQLIDENPVMVFSKTWCSYSGNSKRILDGLNAKYSVYELNQESDGDEIQDALQKLTGQRTVPNIFIGQKHIGGNSDLESHRGNDLEKLLRDAGAIA